MAIDDAEKRRSAFNWSFLPNFPGVTPNVTHDQEWRQEALWSYSGILANFTSATSTGGFAPFVYRRRMQRLRSRKRFL